MTAERGTMITITGPNCPGCSEVHTFEVSKEMLNRIWSWASGQDSNFIQVALPELTSEQREILLTGINDECWSKMMEGSPEE